MSYSSRLFPGRSWFYGLKFLYLALSQSSVLGVKCPRFCQTLNNASFLTIWIIWLSDCGRKRVSECDRHTSKPATNRKESVRERKVCRLMVIECGLMVIERGLRHWRIRNGCEKKNQWSEFYFYSYYYYYYFIFILCNNIGVSFPFLFLKNWYPCLQICREDSDLVTRDSQMLRVWKPLMSFELWSLRLFYACRFTPEMISWRIYLRDLLLLAYLLTYLLHGAESFLISWWVFS
jgi:hypothetical protein